MITYQVFDSETDQLLFEHWDGNEVDDYVQQYDPSTYYINKSHSCKGCNAPDAHERCDAYGIFTGYYCDDCYENNYPYRKDRYPTMENDGYCEYLG